MTYRVALVALSAFASLVSVSADGLSLKVTGPSQVDDISGLLIKATLTNTGTSALTLVDDPRSALSTTPTNTFAISHESGANPDFTGMLVKYGFDLAMANGAVTTLNPGQSIDVTHSLADAYNFTNSGPGSYEISPSTLFHVSDGSNSQPMYANLENSHTVAISGSGRLAVPQEAAQLQKRDALLMKRAVFRGCTAPQQAQINSAISGARLYVNNAISYLRSHTTASRRFTTWFGSFQATRRNAVLSNYNSLTRAGSFTGWTYDCTLSGCSSPGTYAYVFANTYGTVHLCAAFWRAPATGTDSKAGTLVHEGTHFTATAGTRDIAYGQAACQALARNNPNQAIRNADSHEYFAENNPPLP